MIGRVGDIEVGVDYQHATRSTQSRECHRGGERAQRTGREAADDVVAGVGDEHHGVVAQGDPLRSIEPAVREATHATVLAAGGSGRIAPSEEERAGAVVAFDLVSARVGHPDVAVGAVDCHRARIV